MARVAARDDVVKVLRGVAQKFLEKSRLSYARLADDANRSSLEIGSCLPYDFLKGCERAFSPDEWEFDMRHGAALGVGVKRDLAYELISSSLH